MSQPNVRTAIAADLDGLVSSCAALFAEDAAERDHLRNAAWPATHGAEWCTGLLADPNALVLVATTGDEEVVGHLIGGFRPPSEMWTASRAELVSMYVRPAVRGGGAGGRLIDGFVAWARDRGAARLEVNAYAANENALRLYERHGFRRHSVQLVADAP
ncbi:GCN5-related N-acetyltransferase [Kribbella flavida DSM 17836]|uniref:GCN5-related N-acetyltransferase n=1 Tax=Kribbella flavida (strain DSM 17836 / JCM 10339 / NBRC 14399) TaxID=479435 RepID=D2PMQ3_KRIFD|nr:GNAT family N-acetyltransferase [Kribbella flavida]ADB32605.1 GCN5-related N-acetyltransferase [Kribbella flavida DSM 17836]